MMYQLQIRHYGEWIPAYKGQATFPTLKDALDGYNMIRKNREHEGLQMPKICIARIKK